MTTTHKAQILVVGMHRSGTSAVTGLIHRMGAFFADEADSTGIVNDENPKGFWERKDIREANEHLLAATGSDWDLPQRWLKEEARPPRMPKFEALAGQALSALNRHRPWVAKDPRFCLTLRHWLPLLDTPHIVLPIRDPVETAFSLQVRNGFPLDLGLALFEAYMLSALRVLAEQSIAPILVRHDELMQNPEKASAELFEVLRGNGANGLHRIDDDEVLDFIDPSLWRSRPGDVGRRYLDHPASQLYRRLIGGELKRILAAVPALSQTSRHEFALHGKRRRRQHLRAFASAPAAGIEQSVVPMTNDAVMEQTQAQIRNLVQAQRELHRSLLALLPDAAEGEDVPISVVIDKLRHAIIEREGELRRLKGLWTDRARPAIHAIEQRALHLKSEAELAKRRQGEIGNDFKLIRHDFKLHLASMRWRVGDRLIRMVERLLLRKKVRMAHDDVGSTLHAVGQRLKHMGGGLMELPRQAQALIEEIRGVSRHLDGAVPEGEETERIEFIDAIDEGKSVFFAEVALINDEDDREIALRRCREAWSEPMPDVEVPGVARRPLVSIVMPSYNREALIGDAIRSIVQQLYTHWELLVCDDGSSDATRDRAASFGDSRIRVLTLEHRGAAAARNAGLAAAKGRYIAYLDTDNLWHPAYLERMVAALHTAPGRYSVYADYLDVTCRKDGYELRANRFQAFSYDALSESNYIDLNAFMHDAALVPALGGFTDTLVRQQDWDLVLKMTYLRDPLRVDLPLALYRRNHDWGQITVQRRRDTAATSAQVQQNIASYYDGALARRVWSPQRPRLSVLSWDVCRNHFSKAYNIAEVASRDFDVQLLGFRFFQEGLFGPYRNETPSFQTNYLDAGPFPDFRAAMAQAWSRLTGDLIYCVKPRFPSLGLALLANFHRGTPIILESNDSEFHVGDPQGQRGSDDFAAIAMADVPVSELMNPYADAWSKIMDGYARELPIIVSHNRNLDAHYGGRGYYVRNLKDEAHYDPTRYDREAVRRELGFEPDDRVLLFGGLLRKHKGIYELVELVRSLNDPRYKLLFVGSRISPDQERFVREHRNEVRVLPPQGRNEMARINLAADLVVLWLDPAIPASHYQMPYKFTDAIAMRVPVIANDISDLGELAGQGCLRCVPFGDFNGLRKAVRSVFDEASASQRMVDAARRLYLRQFSYAATTMHLRILSQHAHALTGVWPVAERFARDFADLSRRMAGESGDTGQGWSP